MGPPLTVRIVVEPEFLMGKYVEIAPLQPSLVGVKEEVHPGRGGLCPRVTRKDHPAGRSGIRGREMAPSALADGAECAGCKAFPYFVCSTGSTRPTMVPCLSSQVRICLMLPVARAMLVSAAP